MMISEFIERTGFEPTAKEYATIEEAYYDFDGDKDAFCKAFVKDGGAWKLCKARAAEIDRLNSLLLESERQSKKDIADREKRIDELTAKLDQELEWKPAIGIGTNMDQYSYEILTRSARKLTDQQARELIAEACGFSSEKITILHKASTYEVNKHRRLRVSKEYNRTPIYEATDSNYIRFDCANYMYEFVNGELLFYNC